MIMYLNNYKNNKIANIFTRQIMKCKCELLDEIVNVYGEKYRSYIENKFNKISFLYTASYNDILNYLQIVRFAERKKEISAYLQAKGIELPNDAISLCKKNKELVVKQNYDCLTKKMIELRFGQKCFNYLITSDYLYNSLLAIINNNDSFNDEEQTIIGLYETMDLDDLALAVLNKFRGEGVGSFFTPILSELDTYENSSLICLRILTASDTDIIHEILHAIDGKFLAKLESSTIYKAGLKISKDEENFNEYVNQYLAIKIAKSLHSKGIRLMTYDDYMNKYWNCVYNEYIPLIENTLKKYETIIYETKIGDCSSLFKYTIGKNSYEYFLKLLNEASEKDYISKFAMVIFNAKLKLQIEKERIRQLRKK